MSFSFRPMFRFIFSSSPSSSPPPPSSSSSSSDPYGAAAAAPSSSGLSAEQDAKLRLAIMEMEGVTDVYSRLNNTCYEKCLAKFTDGQLTTSEEACLDRCVYKYMAVQTKVSEVFASSQMNPQNAPK